MDQQQQPQSVPQPPPATTQTSVFHPRTSLVKASAPGNRIHARAVHGGDVILFDTSVPGTLCASVGEEFSDFHEPRAATHLRYSRCDRYVATCGEDGKIGLWDRVRSKRFTLLGHRGAVYRVIFNDRSSLMASCGEDGTAIVWDLLAGSSSRVSSGRAVGDKKMVLRGHAGKVLSVAICGTTIATGSEDKTVALWDASTGQHRTILKEHTGTVFCVMFSPSILLPQRVLASAGEDGKVVIWDVSEHVVAGTDLSSTASDKKRSNNNTASPMPKRDSDLSSNASDDTTTATSQQKKQQQSIKNSSPSSSSSIPSTPPRMKAVLYGHEGCVFSLAFSRDGKYLATCGEDSKIVIWLCVSWQRVATLQNDGHTDAVTTAAFCPRNSNLLASGSDDTFVLLWDVKNQVRLQILEGAGGVVNCVHWAPSGDILGSAHEDGSVLFWDISPGKLQATLQAHQEEVKAMCFSPNKKFFVTGGVDKKIFVWDLETWSQRACLEKHVGAISCLQFSPCGTVLASASDDTTVVIWDVEGEWTKKFTFRHHDAPIIKILFEAAPLEVTNNNDSSEKQQKKEEKAVREDNNHHHSSFTSSQLFALRVIDSSGVASLWNIYNGDLLRVVQDVADDLLTDAHHDDENEDESSTTTAASEMFSTKSNQHNHHLDPTSKDHISSSSGGKLNQRTTSSATPQSTTLMMPSSPNTADLLKKVDFDWDRGRRSYIDEEKTSRMFIMESRVHDSTKIANSIMKFKLLMEQKERVRDQICSRVVALEQKEAYETSVSEKKNVKLESEIQSLRDHSHKLERTLAALTGSAKKDKIKSHAAGVSTSVQTFYSMTRDADVAWLTVVPEEPFRFAPDSVCFRVFLEQSFDSNNNNQDGDGDSDDDDSKNNISNPDFVANLSFASTSDVLLKEQKMIEQKRRRNNKPASQNQQTSISLRHQPKILLFGSLQSPNGIASATECFCNVDIPKLIRDKAARGGLAGRPMHGVELDSFDALRLNPAYIQQLAQWLQYVQNQHGSSFSPAVRSHQVDAANNIFNATKSTWIMNTVKRNHFALPFRRPINWISTAFAPCSKSLMYQMAGTSSTNSILTALSQEHGKAFKNLFEQHTILAKAGNNNAGGGSSNNNLSSSLANDQNTIGSSIVCPGPLILSSSIERAAARSIVISNQQKTSSSAKTNSSSSKDTTAAPSPWAKHASHPDVFPILVCSIAVTAMLPATSGSNSDSELASFNKNHLDPFLSLFSSSQMGPNQSGAPSIQNGSSTILLAATRRANFDRIYNDTGNCDYLEFVAPRTSMVVPMGIVWVSVSEDFVEDSLGYMPKIL